MTIIKKSPSVITAASILTGRKAKRGFAHRIITAAIIICGCLGSVFTFLSCVDLGISYVLPTVLIVLCGGALTVIFSGGKRLPSAVSAAVLIAVTFFLRNGICAGIAVMLNAYCETIGPIFMKALDLPVQEPEKAAFHAEIFVCYISVLMCMSSSYSAVRGNSAAGVFAVTAVPVFAVLMFGLEPDRTAFFAFAVSFAAMLALEAGITENIPDDRFRRCSAYCGLYTAVLAVLCVLGVMFFSKVLGYRRPAKLNEIYSSTVEYIYGGGAQQKINEIVIAAKGKTYSTGAINHGKLGEFGEIYFDGRTVLEATLPKSEETVYLRGFVGSVYTGRSWEELPAAKLRQLEDMTETFNAEGLSPLIMDGYNLKYIRAEMPKYSFTVKNIAAGTECLYMPYGLVPESVSRYKIKNGSSFDGTERSYIGQFYDPRGYYGYQNLFRKRWSVPAVLAEDEAAYRNFVYANYLDLPENFEPSEIFDESYYEYITAEESKTGKSTLDEMTVFSRKLYFIKKWLRDNCEYSLSAGKLPAGEDFVNYFLETRKGSCSHFATAAVIMCRYAGIPARYAEGYVVKPMDFPTEAGTGASVPVDITDARGHAWAEVYIDGYGWYPIEFTSGYGNVRTAVPTETTVAESEPETETEPEITETEPENTESAVSAPSPDGAPEGTQAHNAENTVTTTFPVNGTDISTEVPPVETAEVTEIPKPTVGFSVFGIQGSNKVDVRYDLTWLIILIAAAAAVPAGFVLRRNAVSARRRRIAGESASAGAMDDYRRFCRIMKLMGMPEQGGMTYDEYASELSLRSEMLSDGTAELVIGSALKASFGGGTLSRSEADELRLAVNSLAKRVFITMSRFGKFKMKFLYCVI